MNSSNQDKAKSASNLQKLFSSHVLENYSLKRQKSGLDYEKRKKLKELNNNEHLFLRKYEKYVVPGNRSRRSSIDAELARAIETNYNTCNRPQSQIADKSFAKDSITDECPYSLETWSRLVDSEKSIIDENKQDILFGGDKEVKNDNDSNQDTEMLLDEMFRTNISILESGKRLQRRQTLKPLERTNNDYNEDTVDEEIVEIQFKQKRRGRRHSVALGALYGGEINRDKGLKLPSISERNGSFSKSKNALSDLDIQALSSKSKIYSSDENVSFAERKPTKGMSLGYDSSEVGKPVQAIKANGQEEANHDIVKYKSPLRRNTPRPAENVTVTPRPVANATIFVQEETYDDKNSIFDTKLKIDDTENTCLTDSEPKQQSNFLPKIEITKPDGFENDGNDISKHVSFVDEDNDMRDGSDSFCSKLTAESESQSRKKGGRRNSMATASLKLLVDSHHGAAKLRYIARLAHEMEREEIAKHTPEPEPDMYKELNDCRYLRVVPRKGSAQSRDSGVI